MNIIILKKKVNPILAPIASVHLFYFQLKIRDGKKEVVRFHQKIGKPFQFMDSITQYYELFFLKFSS